MASGAATEQKQTPKIAVSVSAPDTAGLAHGAARAPPTAPNRALSLAHISLPVWQARGGVANSLQHLFPDLPPHVVTTTGLRRWIRKQLDHRLARRLPAARAPMCTDPRALLGAYDLRCGTSPVDSPLDPAALHRLHRERCGVCRAAGGARSDCYIHKLLDVCRYGWLLNTAAVPTHRPRRYPLRSEERAALDADLRADLAAGYVEQVPRTDICPTMSPRFVITKQVLARTDMASAIEAGTVSIDDPACWRIKYRAVTDFSQSGINDAADKWPCSMPSIDEAVSLCRVGGWAASCDIRKGFSNIPLAQSSSTYMVFEQQDHDDVWRRYRYRTCGFGHTAFPGGFMVFTAELLEVCRARGIPCTVYVDDWFVVGATKAACQTNLDALIAVLNEVGFTVAPEKVVQPTQLCPWLGFVIDLSTSRVVVSKARFARLRAEARWCLEHASRCPTARLATIAGRLSHAAQAVVGSRAFLVALHSMAAVDRPVVSLSAAARDDLSWWMTESIEHNGVRAWMRGGSPHPELPFLSFFSDASGVDGFGAHTASECVVGSYGDADPTVPYRELWAVFRMLQHVLGSKATSDVPPTRHVVPRGSILVALTDAAGNCFRINSGRASGAGSPTVQLIRRIFALCHDRGITLVALHVPREANSLADALSHIDDISAATDVLRACVRPRVPARYQVSAPHSDSRPSP